MSKDFFRGHDEGELITTNTQLRWSCTPGGAPGDEDYANGFNAASQAIKGKDARSGRKQVEITKAIAHD